MMVLVFSMVTINGGFVSVDIFSELGLLQGKETSIELLVVNTKDATQGSNIGPC